MKKRLMLIALLLAAVLLLSACSSTTENNNTQTNNTAVGQVAPMNNTAANDAAANAAAAAKEEEDKLLTSSLYDANGNRIYAGATPVPIDPVDLPTATPRPELTFTYDWYTASKLGITFRSAVGYTVSDGLSDTYILTEPAIAVRDNYPCTISLTVTAITKNHTVADVKTDLANFLQNEGRQYETWQTWTAESRTLMDGKGYYNNYRGVLADGTVVRGRVHMAIIGDNQLLTLHISCPGGYNSSYMKIYDQIRSSIKPVK